MPAFKDLTGQRFGKLEVVSRAPARSKGAFWNVKCDCGVEKVISASSLARGHARSCGCGCGVGEAASRRMLKHGATVRKVGTPVKNKAYLCWTQVKQRCTNPNAQNYHRYGGRGITMHSDWVEDFAAFLRDVGEPPEPNMTLDRIDNDGNYEPGNVRWATRKEQANNRSTNLLITWEGKTMSMSQWAEHLGCKRGLLSGRWKAGLRGAELFAPAKWVRGTTVEVNGEVTTIHELAAKTGIPYVTLKWRHKHGRPLL